MAQTVNIASVLDHAAARWPSATALHCGDTALTFAGLRRRVDALAADLAARGAGLGATFALLAPNTPEFVCAYFAVLKTGATVLSINPLALPANIADQMRLCGARELLVYPALDRPALREALGGLQVTPITLPGESPEHFETVYPGPEAVAVRLFTSGTTGAAKAVGLSHYNLFLNALLCREVLACAAGDRVLAALPLAYGIGQSGLLNGPFTAGAAVVLQPGFQPAEALELITRHRVTAMIGVPTLYRKMLDAAAPGAPARFAGHWRIACIGGAPVPPEFWAELEHRLGPQVVIGYGLSETSPMLCASLPGTPPAAHLVGPPLVGIDVSVRAPEGQPLPNGTPGELWARGHNIGLGYLVPEGAPAPDAFGPAWFKTGDVARIDDAGNVYILGRIKDIIIRSGHKINPAEIEQALARCPGVAGAAVLGIPDPVTGEEIAACIVPAPGHGDPAQLTAAIAAWVRAELPAYAYPRHLRLVDAFPLGPTGKILKTELRALFGNGQA